MSMHCNSIIKFVPLDTPMIMKAIDSINSIMKIIPTLLRGIMKHFKDGNSNLLK